MTPSFSCPDRDYNGGRGLHDGNCTSSSRDLPRVIVSVVFVLSLFLFLAFSSYITHSIKIAICQVTGLILLVYWH